MPLLYRLFGSLAVIALLLACCPCFAVNSEPAPTAVSLHIDNTPAGTLLSGRDARLQLVVSARSADESVPALHVVAGGSAVVVNLTLQSDGPGVVVSEGAGATSFRSVAVDGAVGVGIRIAGLENEIQRLRSAGTSLLAEIQAATVEGFIAGLTAFAWWKDGTQYVGAGVKTLAQAIAEARHAQSEDAKR